MKAVQTPATSKPATATKPADKTHILSEHGRPLAAQPPKVDPSHQNPPPPPPPKKNPQTKKPQTTESADMHLNDFSPNVDLSVPVGTETNHSANEKTNKMPSESTSSPESNVEAEKQNSTRPAKKKRKPASPAAPPKVTYDIVGIVGHRKENAPLEFQVHLKSRASGEFVTSWIFESAFLAVDTERRQQYIAEYARRVQKIVPDKQEHEKEEQNPLHSQASHSDTHEHTNNLPPEEETSLVAAEELIVGNASPNDLPPELETLELDDTSANPHQLDAATNASSSSANDESVLPTIVEKAVVEEKQMVTRSARKAEATATTSTAPKKRKAANPTRKTNKMPSKDTRQHLNDSSSNVDLSVPVGTETNHIVPLTTRSPPLKMYGHFPATIPCPGRAIASCDIIIDGVYEPSCVFKSDLVIMPDKMINFAGKELLFEESYPPAHPPAWCNS